MKNYGILIKKKCVLEFINKKTLKIPFDFSFDFLDVINLFDHSSFEKSKWAVLRNFF